MTAIQLRVPVEGTLIINPVGGIMDKRLLNGGKTKGKKLTQTVKVEQRKVDGHVPGKPFTIAKALKGKVTVKAKKVPGICVFKNCTAHTSGAKAKWCVKHRIETRRIAMRVNKARWLAKQAA